MDETVVGHRIGPLAARTGLTVRTPHHYDRIGLLRPGGRTPAGHRVYGQTEVQRLYTIVALRSLGMPLARIAETLDRGLSLHDAVTEHLEGLDRQLDDARRLRRRLSRILDVLERSEEPSSDQLVHAIEEATKMERYYTPGQLADLDRRGAEMGPEAIEQSQRDWAELIAEVRTARDIGTDPSDPIVQALMHRWDTLIEAFTGGDAGITAGLAQKYRDEGFEGASHGMLDADLMDYVARAHR